MVTRGAQKSGTGSRGRRSTTSASSTGSAALHDGQITPAQFVDLNAKIGGADIDTNPFRAGGSRDEPALANAYRSGMINETNNLNQTAIIDCRGPNPGLATTPIARSPFGRALIASTAPTPTS